MSKISPWIRYMALSSQLLGLLGLAVYAGIKLDEKWALSPLLIITLPLLVLIGTFYKLIKETHKRKNIHDPKK